MAELDPNRQRLKETRQSDLTEGRINQDFLDWLKSGGVTWLLAIMIFVLGYVGWVRWQEHRKNQRAEAWNELASANLPSSLEDVASKYEEVGAVSDLALLRAAQQLLNAVQAGQALGSDPTQPTPLSEADHTDYLRRADGLFQRVAEHDDRSLGKTLLTMTALTGRAAVAESRGELDQAGKLYEQAAARASDHYPQLAEVIRKRAATASTFTSTPQLPSNEELQRLNENVKPPQYDSVTLENWVRELVMPAAASAGQ